MTTDEQDLRVDPQDRTDWSKANRRRRAVWPGALAVAVAAAAAFWWWSAQWRTPTPLPPIPTALSTSGSNPIPAASGPAFPLDTSQAIPMSKADIEPALAQLFGARTVASLLQVDDFARRAVATLDNLGRAHAPPAVWPVQPMAGRFTVHESPSGTVIAPSNTGRYAAFMQMIDTVDSKKAVELYLRMYPLLQQAYRELGFGDRYLNDRVIEVVDLLLDAPEPPEPPLVKLMEVRGSVEGQRPWVRYEYADARLEALPAGQKILVRLGLANEQRVKRKLAELRKLTVTGTLPR